MPRTQDRLVFAWIIVFGSLAVLLVVYGGFVRLTRSGLSIVEWNPVGGTIPPLTQQQWQIEFSKYQASPEYQQINSGMSLADYKEIFLVEWFHRVLARLAGLVFAVPLFVFLLNKRIPWKESFLYLVMGVLFLAQAVMGWIMVSSGLVERPSVSHYLLAAHLFLALSLIGLSAWTALGHLYGFAKAGASARWSLGSKAALLATIMLLVQMAYGALTAGLKAGLVSNSWPRMLGRWIPRGLLSQTQPPLLNLIEAPVTVVFIHRWLALFAFLVAVIGYYVIRRTHTEPGISAALGMALALGLLQIALGIGVVISSVNIALASWHQFNAICLFITAIYLLHRLRSRDRHERGAATP